MLKFIINKNSLQLKFLVKIKNLNMLNWTNLKNFYCSYIIFDSKSLQIKKKIC